MLVEGSSSWWGLCSLLLLHGKGDVLPTRPLPAAAAAGVVSAGAELDPPAIAVTAAVPVAAGGGIKMLRGMCELLLRAAPASPCAASEVLGSTGKLLLLLPRLSSRELDPRPP